MDNGIELQPHDQRHLLSDDPNAPKGPPRRKISLIRNRATVLGDELMTGVPPQADAAMTVRFFSPLYSDARPSWPSGTRLPSVRDQHCYQTSLSSPFHCPALLRRRCCGPARLAFTVQWSCLARSGLAWRNLHCPAHAIPCRPALSAAPSRSRRGPSCTPLRCSDCCSLLYDVRCCPCCRALGFRGAENAPHCRWCVQ